MLIVNSLAFSQTPPNCDSTNSPGRDTVNNSRLTWKQNAPVKVYLYDSGNGTFNDTEKACIQAVLQAWNDSDGNGTFESSAGVKFELVNEPIPPVEQTNENNPIYVITKSKPQGGNDFAETGKNSKDSETHSHYAITNMDPGITDCQALKETLSHEVGHTFDLGDCTGQNCSPNTSTMTIPPCTQGPLDSEGNPTCSTAELNQTGKGRVGPSDCDKFKIKLINNYNPQTYNPSGTPTPTPTPGGDPGGGGECDCGDCINGCNEPDPPCTDTLIPGACYTVCVTYCDEGEIDPYTGLAIPGSQNCYDDCSTECDPDQIVCL